MHVKPCHFAAIPIAQWHFVRVNSRARQFYELDTSSNYKQLDTPPRNIVGRHARADRLHASNRRLVRSPPYAKTALLVYAWCEDAIYRVSSFSAALGSSSFDLFLIRPFCLHNLSKGLSDIYAMPLFVAGGPSYTSYSRTYCQLNRTRPLCISTLWHCCRQPQLLVHAAHRPTFMYDTHSVQNLHNFDPLVCTISQQAGYLSMLRHSPAIYEFVSYHTCYVR